MKGIIYATGKINSVGVVDQFIGLGFAASSALACLASCERLCLLLCGVCVKLQFTNLLSSLQPDDIITLNLHPSLLHCTHHTPLHHIQPGLSHRDGERERERKREGEKERDHSRGLWRGCG